MKVQQKEIEVAVEAKESPTTEGFQNKSDTEARKVTQKNSQRKEITREGNALFVAE